jgi:predicted nucleic acid-binding protein
MRLWVDTNILLRLVTKTPDDLFQRAVRLVAEAEENGRLTLAAHPLYVAEATYVLRGLYRYTRHEVREALGIVLRLRALEVFDEDYVMRALDLMAERDVDFDDAYLALWARERHDGVASFDRDFARLPVRWREP